MSETFCTFRVSVLLIIVIFQSILLLMYIFDFEADNLPNAPDYKLGENVSVSSMFTCIKATDTKKKVNTQSNKITNLLMSIAQKMQKVEIHSKSMKALNAIRKANDEMALLFHDLGMNYDKIQTRNIATVPENVCPEKYEGHEFGFPLFEKGFTTAKCPYGKPISSIVTIMIASTVKNRDLKQLVSSIKRYLQNVSVLIGTNYPLSISEPFVTVKSNLPGSEGAIWNALLSEVSTKYVLVARDLSDFDEYANIERLIREKELFGISAAGGSLRDIVTRHWSIGCHQRAFRNYTLIYQEGYDETQHGCLVCDHIDGSFIIETKRIREIKFDSSFTVGLFEDFFIRLGYEQTLACPDVMFHTRTVERPSIIKQWTALANKHEIHKLKFSPGFEIIFPCVYPYKCHKGERNTISPCCMEELNNMTHHVSQYCEKHGIVCELNGGTILAAVKMNMAFPWDVDADIMFHLSNYTVLKSTVGELNNRIYRISMSQRPKYQNKQLILGAYNLNSKYWFLEIWGKTELTTSKYILNGKNQTKVLLYGKWLGAPANPGAWTRNRYGDDMFFHAEHWRHLGRKNAYQHLPSDKSRRFRTCKNPGDQKCLDNFNAIGNLQFKDPIP